MRAVWLTALLLAGCAAPAPVAPIDDMDGWTVTAVRVEPRNHPIHWTAHLDTAACSDPVQSCTVAGEGGAVAVFSTPAQLQLREPGSLFWRYGFNVSFDRNGLADTMHLTVVTVDENGSTGRKLVDERAAGRVEVRWSETIMEPGETGLRIRIEAPAMFSATNGARRTVQVDGLLQAFLPAPA